MARPLPVLSAALLGLVFVGTVAGCTSAPIDTVRTPATGELAAGSPVECAGSFPFALGPVTVHDLGLIPADWPSTPASSVLCATTRTNGGLIETVEYATALGPAAVLEYYAAELPVEAGVEFIDGAAGVVLVGELDPVSFEIRPVDGRFAIVLSEERQ
jgi:hypothetical protein